MLIVLVGMVALVWFTSRRNRKQQQQQDGFRSTLEVGQRVLTVGGMVGVISGIEGDVVTLSGPGGGEIAVLRRAIRSQVTDDEWGNMIQPYPPEDSDDAEADAADEDDAADAADGVEDDDQSK
jgi:preprotein translocase subunit YajC